MAGQFMGKVALVTGAASGIGRASALAFAHEGAAVIAADVTEGGGQQTVERIRDTGGDAKFVRTDVTRAEEVEALVRAAIETYGRLDFAHNNAGIEGERGQTTDYPAEAWHRVIAVNLTGVWLCMKYELPELLRQSGGAIVNTASIAGLVGGAGSAAYTASKHGVVGLTRSVAVEYAQQGIRVNAVCPGGINTPMLERVAQVNEPEGAARVAALHPMNRMGSPDEIAAAVVWLCSEASSFVTGHMLTVDGGWVAR